MTPRLTILDALTALVVTALVAVAAWVAVAGPTGPIPMHFDSQMRPDRWGDRYELAGVTGFMALMAAATAGAMGWFAARSPDAARARGLRIGQIISLIAIAGVSLLLLWTTLGAVQETPVAPSSGWVMALMGVIFTVTGAFLGRVAPNPLVGVRTPWNFKSRLAWDRSNRLAGRLFFWIGLATLIAAPLAPQPAGMGVVIFALIAAAAWSIVESWRVWRTDPDRQPF